MKLGLHPGVAALVVTHALIGAVGSASAEPSEGKERAVEVRRAQYLPGVEYNVEGRDAGSTRLPQPSSPLRRRTARERPPVYYAVFPTYETLPDGARCVRMIRRAYASPMAAGVAGDSQNILSLLDAPEYPPCPSTPRPAPTAAAEAASFWRVAGEDLLPKPDPRIAPGYMLAGKRAYLEARTVPSATFTHPTPLGLLTIEATSGKLYVDWDDGTGLRGPYDGPGEPWPDGKITHFWTNAGTYNVRVQQRWRATWRLATGESGELDALATEAVLEDFEVRELQAVRNR